MPCYAVRTVTLDLDAANTALLISGLREAGFTVNEYLELNRIVFRKGYTQGFISGGKVTVNEGSEGIVNEIKKAYSTEVVKTAAKRFGWTFKQDAKVAGHATLKRRAF